MGSKKVGGYSGKFHWVRGGAFPLFTPYIQFHRASTIYYLSPIFKAVTYLNWLQIWMWFTLLTHVRPMKYYFLQNPKKRTQIIIFINVFIERTLELSENTTTTFNSLIRVSSENTYWGNQLHISNEVLLLVNISHILESASIFIQEIFYYKYQPISARGTRLPPLMLQDPKLLHGGPKMIPFILSILGCFFEKPFYFFTNTCSWGSEGSGQVLWMQSGKRTPYCLPSVRRQKWNSTCWPFYNEVNGASLCWAGNCHFTRTVLHCSSNSPSSHNEAHPWSCKKPSC